MHRMGRIVYGIVIIASLATATLVLAEPPKDGAEPMRRQVRMHQGSRQPLHGEMREKMRAHDARIDELVAAMNAAQGEAKVEAIAAVVNELVEQRRTRRDHMEERWQGQQGAKEKK